MPAGLARWDVKVWRPEDHPRDPRTGRFVRKPDGQIRYRRRPRRNGHKASAETRDLLSKARKSLPKGAHWAFVTSEFRPPERRVDRRLRDFEAELADAKAKLAAAEAELEAEFKRKRTPKSKRDQIRRERLWQLQINANHAQKTVDYVRELANDPNLATRPDNERNRWGEMLPAQWTPNYGKDRNGVLVPPPELDKHLDTVLKVGEGIHSDYVDAKMRDPEIARLDQMKAGIDQRLRTARIEDRHDLLKQRVNVNRHVAQREQEILVEVLNSVRPVGGVRHAKATAATSEDMRGHDGAYGARTDWRARLAVGERFFPEDWLRASADQPLVVGTSPRAFYSRSLKGGGTLAMADRTRDSSHYSGAFRDDTDETTVHELGHRMEQIVPGITALEFAYQRRRAMKDGEVEPARRLRDITRHNGYRDNEWSMEDEWAGPYAGKTYEGVAEDGRPLHPDPAKTNWEVFQVGLQDTFGRSNTRYGGVELQWFVLGVLASLETGRK